MKSRGSFEPPEQSLALPLVAAIPVEKREEKRKMKGWLDPNEPHAKSLRWQIHKLTHQIVKVKI